MPGEPAEEMQTNNGLLSVVWDAAPGLQVPYYFLLLLSDAPAPPTATWPSGCPVETGLHAVGRVGHHAWPAVTICCHPSGNIADATRVYCNTSKAMKAKY